MKTIIFTITTIIFLISCKPECEIYYHLEIPVSVSPVNDTINIGDTLWIEFDFSDMIRDTVSNKVLYVDDEMTRWAQDMHIYFYKSTDITLPPNNQGPGVFSFEFANEIGAINIQNDVITSVYFEYENNKYHLKTGLISKETGVFFVTFGFSNPYNHNRNYIIDIKQAEDEKCVESISLMYFKVNEQSDGSFNTNSHILSDNSGVTIGHNSNITYSFVVK